jgi:hypothetical protein
VHEATHVLQRCDTPDTYAVACNLEGQLRAQGSATRSDYFDLYIGQPLEQEARAQQAAAEVSSEAGTSLAKNVFEAELTQTEVWSRTKARIGLPTARARKVKLWWRTWSAMSWDIYQSLR